MHHPTRALALTLALFLGSLVAGAWTGAQAVERAHDPYAPLDALARSFAIVERSYVDELPPDALVANALRGLVGELDPHSAWFSAEEYRAFQEDNQGSYEGIGVEVRSIPEGVEVARVVPGGPAERDGLLAGDRIIAVDDEPLAGLSIDQVAGRLKGQRGTAVRVRVVREGWEAPRELSTVRDRVFTPSVESARLDGDIAYVRLLQFQEDTGRDLEAAVRRLDAEAPLKGLVLDLRDNPGGLLDEAVAVCDLFLDEGVIVSTRSRGEGEAQHRATVGGLRHDLKVSVLVNGMSASASEIVAAALQETGRARVFGTHTYGKGSVQTVFENPDHSALKLTIGRYYTPSGEPVAANSGREPDVEVPWPAPPGPKSQLLARLDDPSLDPALRDELRALAEKVAADPEREPRVPWGKPPAERLAVDPQLTAAVADLVATP